MLHDANDVESGSELRADVCIVGAGAAGIALTVELASSGVSVLVLESGGLRRDEETHRLNQGESAGLAYAPLEACRSRFLGGSTNCWGGWSRPLEQADLAAHPWLPESGWPLSMDELQPYYERACTLLELASHDYDPWLLRRLEDGNARVLPLDANRVVTKMLRFSPPSRFGTLYRDRIRDARTVRCLLHANAVEIVTDDTGRVALGVDVATLAGVRFRVTARYVVLAAGGIENPRLMLLSTGASPDGIGNRHGLVGRYFMEHGARYGSELLSDQPPRLDLYDSTFNYQNPRFAIDGSPAAAFLSLSETVRHEEELLAHRAFFHTTYPGEDTAGMEALRRLVHRSRFVESSSEPWRDVVRAARAAPLVAAGLAARRLGLRRFGTPRLMTVVEPEPTPDSRVELATSRDALGLRRARVVWRLTDRVHRTFLRVQEIVGSELRTAGIGSLGTAPEPDESPLMWCWHHIGTTRMHDDARRGVVDRDGLVHGTSNLYIAGSSVFPTAGCDMPTLTIVALAVRTADRLKALLAAKGPSTA